jgi:hypothetical protein
MCDHDNLRRDGPQFCPDCDAAWTEGDECEADCPRRDEQPEDFIAQRQARYSGAAGQSEYFGVDYPIP